MEVIFILDCFLCPHLKDAAEIAGGIKPQVDNRIPNAEGSNKQQEDSYKCSLRTNIGTLDLKHNTFITQFKKKKLTILTPSQQAMKYKSISIDYTSKLLGDSI